ncbi:MULTISPECIES: hypothetical protein [Microbulbifer]|uniref:hypothetical protein n=1 Tax=Microbulbifer TaxID=48073 RepID=UPI001E3AFBD0|nr:MULTISPECIES: hypothetical protein [Microbulbifer]UHQ54973.1 hypothetical protein LVE68_15915 [Microbulbifer sp. YPW16]
MIIFIYTLLIVALGIGNKLILGLSGAYQPVDFIKDLPLIVLTYFGLYAIWGRARGKRYISQRFWQIYFVLLVISVLAMPLLDKDIASAAQEVSVVQALVGYLVVSALMIPYFWGLYKYAYSASSIWRSS